MNSPKLILRTVTVDDGPRLIVIADVVEFLNLVADTEKNAEAENALRKAARKLLRDTSQ